MTVLLLSALLAVTAQELQVRAELSSTSVRVGEPVSLRITADLRGGGRIISPAPVMPLGLSIAGTSESTSTSISVPGGRTTTSTHEYVLIASAPGSYTIPAVRVLGTRTSASSQPLTLTVSDAPPPHESSEALLVVRMQPDTVFVGQQSTLVAEALMAPDLQMRLTRPPAYNPPAPAEFWIQDLSSPTQVETLYRDGQRFNAQRFYRAYFPLTPGRFSFAPARLVFEARQGFVFAPRAYELRSSSPHLTVLPLPTEGRPTDFRGAVGKFELTSAIDPLIASVGDAVTLTVEVRGIGNIKGLPPPVLPELAGADVLDPSENAEIDPGGTVVRGTKRFSWVIVPNRVGRIEIPSVSYSSFDPESRRYTTQQTVPAAIEVSPAAAGAARARVSAIRERTAADPLAFARTRAFLAIQALPLLAVVGALALRRRRVGPASSIRRKWKERLSASWQSTDFAGALEQLVRDALYEASRDQRFRSGAITELDLPLERLLGNATAARVRELLFRLESARYTATHLPGTERVALRDEAAAILDELWTLMQRGGRSAMVPVALLLLQLQTPAGEFEQGVLAYNNREIPAAIAAFERYTRLHPEDASGWYNLGVSYQTQRQPAHAAWAFLHAIRIEPHNNEVQGELNRAGVQALARRIRPATGLTPNGLLIVLAALWWLACLLVATWLLTRRRVFGGFALVPLIAAGLLVATAAIERALPPPAIVLDQPAALLAGRSLHSETVRQLQPLTGVSVIREEEGWLQVRTAEGESGWVRADRVGRL